MTILPVLTSLLGEKNVIALGDPRIAAHLQDGLFHVHTDGAEPYALVLPGSAEDVAAILRAANREGIPVVPQGGLTGLAGGALPIGRCLLLSMKRMNQIEEVDADSMTITVEAGVLLQNVQEAAEAEGLMFPLDFGARGSAQVGGIISTNAGGNRVVRFGMARDLVLGLEVVLADGSVLTMLNKMLKNNSGYDLKQYFIGAEGTLGVITKAVLRLVPRVVPAMTALCALKTYEHVLAFLRMARRIVGTELTSFEVMWPDFYEIGTRMAGRPSPLPEPAGIYVLLETMNCDGSAELGQNLLERALDDGFLQDAVVASSIREANELWEIRECTDVLIRTYGSFATFDASIPTAQIGRFLEELQRQLRMHWPAVEFSIFGHIADANLHINVRLDERAGNEREVEDVVYRLIGEWEGGVSGEHGIGMHKVAYLKNSRDENQIVTMAAIKRALDPNGILNPDKVFVSSKVGVV